MDGTSDRREARPRQRPLIRVVITCAISLPPNRGARRAPSPARLAARQREGRPPQLERGEQHGQAHPAAAEPGQLGHTARAGRVRIGRHDQAIDGGEQTEKTFEHGVGTERRRAGNEASVPAPAPRVRLWVLRGSCGPSLGPAAETPAPDRPRAAARPRFRLLRFRHGGDSPITARDAVSLRWRQRGTAWSLVSSTLWCSPMNSPCRFICALLENVGAAADDRSRCSGCLRIMLAVNESPAVI
ncbi:hypothetical protein KS03_5665 (plasmid) [Burkholderia glumae LMG 2196 = ATCC 33617]|nr:hypothetical protein KS03_5665 [Burkholderia glumae LMG 2196 = ATCC 33617]